MEKVINAFAKIGDIAAVQCCVGILYEPEVPEELLK